MTLSLVYNGAGSGDTGGFTAYGGALRVVLSSHPGALEATVKSTSPSFLVAVPEDMSYAAFMNTREGAYRQLILRPPGKEGTAKLEGLKPGRYRVFLSPTFTPLPDAFEDSRRQAASVTIEEDQTAIINLD